MRETVRDPQAVAWRVASPAGRWVRLVVAGDTVSVVGGWGEGVL